MAVLDDSNLAHRGGLEGLRHAQRAARGFLAAGGAARPERLGSRVRHRPRLRGAGACRPAARPTRLAAAACSAASSRCERSADAMSFALLFSGQGTQHPAMLPWLADGELVRTNALANSALRIGARTSPTPPGPQRNANAQVAADRPGPCGMVAAGALAAGACGCAGYSVGELASFAGGRRVRCDDRHRPRLHAGRCDGPMCRKHSRRSSRRERLSGRGTRAAVRRVRHSARDPQWQVGCRARRAAAVAGCGSAHGASGRRDIARDSRSKWLRIRHGCRPRQTISRRPCPHCRCVRHAFPCSATPPTAS